MFKLNSVGRKLYFSVLAVFLVFAVSFIVFQQAREKQYKIGTLTIKLENYNELLAEDLALSPGEGIILQDSIHNRDVTVAHEKLQAFVREHESKDLRVTLVRPNGKVIYDNMSSDYDHFANHAKREEIAEALKNRVYVTLWQSSTSDSRALLLTLQYNFNTSKNRYKGKGAGNEELNRFE